MKARRARRKRRERERRRERGLAEEEMGELALEDEEEESGMGDWVERVTEHCLLRSSSKIRSFSLLPTEPPTTSAIQILLQLNNNSLETWSIPSGSEKSKSKNRGKGEGEKNKHVEAERKFVVDGGGHRGDVRCLGVSGDDQVVASASNGECNLFVRLRCFLSWSGDGKLTAGIIRSTQAMELEDGGVY